jgi:hypothetical protein
MKRIDGHRLNFLLEHYKRAIADPKTYEDMFYFCEVTGYVEGVIDSSPVLQSQILEGQNILDIVNLVVQYMTQDVADDLSKPAVDIIHAAILKANAY